jgi:hypothetical protein
MPKYPAGRATNTHPANSQEQCDVQARLSIAALGVRVAALEQARPTDSGSESTARAMAAMVHLSKLLNIPIEDAVALYVKLSAGFSKVAAEKGKVS